VSGSLVNWYCLPVISGAGLVWMYRTGGSLRDTWIEGRIVRIEEQEEMRVVDVEQGDLSGNWERLGRDQSWTSRHERG